MKPVYKFLAWSIVSLASASAFATVGNNPASVQYVQDYVNNAIAHVSSAKKYAVGDLAFGGVVFFVDSTGEHGLAVSCSDIVMAQTSGTPQNLLVGVSPTGPQPADCSGTTGTVNCYQYVASDGSNQPGLGASASGFGAGAMNTPIISSAQTGFYNTATMNAAMAALFGGYSITGAVCNPSASPITTTCYGGYYLPSLWEMQALGETLPIVNASISANCPSTNSQEVVFDQQYWTSTESNSNGSTSNAQASQAYSVFFPTEGLSSAPAKVNKTSALRVRPIVQF